jgi:hypothetical protein
MNKGQRRLTMQRPAATPPIYSTSKDMRFGGTRYTETLASYDKA